MDELNEVLRGLTARTTPPKNSPTSSAADQGPAYTDDGHSQVRPRPAPPLPAREGVDATYPLDVPVSCTRCGGIGYVLLDVPVGHPDFGKAVTCQCKESERQWRRLSRLQNISDVEGLARYGFDSFMPEPAWLPVQKQKSLRRAYDTARAFADEPHGWLILTGTYGCGKTHLAAAIANHRLDRGHQTIFAVVPDLLDHLRATFGPNSEIRYDELFEQVRSTGLLVLDDLGTQSSTPWAQEKLFQILNHRYNSQLPTVLTANQRLEDLDQRLRSRLLDINLVVRVHITAPDYRSGASPSQSDLSTLALYSDQQLRTFDIGRRGLSNEESSNLRRVVEAVSVYAEEPKGWLVLMGPHGTGKTHLAAAVANHQLESAQNDAMFVVVPDFLDYLRAAFNPQSPVPYDRRFDEVRRTPLLILDDLGTESATPWAREKLFQLLNYRYSATLPTVITTTDNIQEIEPWLRTRMADVERCQIWALKVPSYRGGIDQQEDQRRRRRR